MEIKIKFTDIKCSVIKTKQQTKKNESEVEVKNPIEWHLFYSSVIYATI